MAANFKEIEATAADYHGGIAELRKKLRTPLTVKQIRALSDDRYLSELSKVTFQIGFNWSLVDKKWPAFEESFFGFDLALCSSLPDEALEAAMASGTIIKNWRKVKAIRSNAQWFSSVANEHGSVGNYIAQIEASNYFQSLLEFQKGGTNVGVRTLQIWLRKMGVDAFVLTQDVERALKRYGVLEKAPSTKSAWKKLQDQIDTWMEEGDYCLANISQTLAYSIGPN